MAAHREEHVLKVGDVDLERVAAPSHLDEDVEHLLDELAVDDLALALAADEL